MIWILFIFGIFGISIVAVLMGICLLCERIFHRRRLRPITRDTWWVIKVLAERERALVKPLTERDLVWRDFVTFWSIVALGMLVLVPLAAWVTSVRLDLLLALHPVPLYGWWSYLRSQRVRHPEVYVVSVWMLGFVSGILAFLAPYRLSGWGFGDFDLVKNTSESFGIGVSVVQVAIPVLVGVGLATALASIVLTRKLGKFQVALAMTVAVWMPIAYIVWLNGNVFFALGLFMAVGVAGYGISRHARRMRDVRERRDAMQGTTFIADSLTLWHDIAPSLAIQFTIMVLVAIGIAGLAHHVLLEDRTAIIATTWTVVALAASASVMLPKLNRDPIVSTRIVPLVVIVTVFGLSMFTNSIWSLNPIFGEESGGAQNVFDIVALQATILGYVTLVGIVIAVARKRVREYGAMLLGFMFVPTAHYLADLHVGEGRWFASLQGPGIVTVTLLACVTLFIMWRMFGPGANQPPVVTDA